MPKAKGNRHKQQGIISERPVYEEGQDVVRVVRACGENIYEVEDAAGAKDLYELPKRLRHVVFIKRGTYVFIRRDATRGGGKVRGDIEVVVIDHFLNSLRSEEFWPAAFAKGAQGRASAAGQEAVEDGDDDWEIGGGNPNRRRQIESDSSDEDG